MQTKTAMQQYLEWLGELKKCDPALSPTITMMEVKATELLSVEREQIETAWDVCEDFCTDWDNNAVYGSEITHPNKEQYFSKNYPQ